MTELVLLNMLKYFLHNCEQQPGNIVFQLICVSGWDQPGRGLTRAAPAAQPHGMTLKTNMS